MTIEQKNTLKFYAAMALVGFANGAMTGTQFKRRQLSSVAGVIAQLAFIYFASHQEIDTKNTNRKASLLSSQNLYPIFILFLGWTVGFEAITSLSKRRLKALQ